MDSLVAAGIVVVDIAAVVVGDNLVVVDIDKEVAVVVVVDIDTLVVAVVEDKHILDFVVVDIEDFDYIVVDMLLVDIVDYKLQEQVACAEIDLHNFVLVAYIAD